MDYGYGLGALFAVGIGASLLGLIIGIVIYVLTALGLYKLAQKQNFENAWLAWIPFIQYYIIGKIVGEAKFGTAFTVPKLELILPLAPIAIWVVTIIPYLGLLIAVLAAIAYAVLFIYSLYLLYMKYVPEQAMLYTILSALSLYWIFIFVIRDKDQVAAE